MGIIDINHYYKKFNHKNVYNDFSLHINKGEMIAIVGPSGSGKTTLLNMIGLIDPIQDGNYLLFGEPSPRVNSRKANRVIREKISYLFQNFALVDNFTVQENLLMALKYVKKNKQEKKKLISKALNDVGLRNYEGLRIFEISGGEQQRVAIARTILKPSEIILADEPTGALDPQNRNEILSLLKKLNKDNKTIIIVTHDPVVSNFCSRTIELGSGSSLVDTFK